MAKIVLDVPEGFMGLVNSWRETLEGMKAAVGRTDGGKARVSKHAHFKPNLLPGI